MQIIRKQIIDSLISVLIILQLKTLKSEWRISRFKGFAYKVYWLELVITCIFGSNGFLVDVSDE